MKGKTLSVVLLAVIGMVTVVAMSFMIGNITKANKLAKIENKVTVALKGMHEGDVSFAVESIQDCTKEAGVTMAKLNLTEEAVQKILQQGYISEIRSLIAKAYKAKCIRDIDLEISLAKKYAKLAGKNLSYFGLTDEKLKDIIRQGNISEARYLIDLAQSRKGEGHVELLIEMAREHAMEAGTTLDKI